MAVDLERTRRRSREAGCEHTLHHSDRLGNLKGTWKHERLKGRVRVVCEVCGRFYGYLSFDQQERAAGGA